MNGDYVDVVKNPEKYADGEIINYLSDKVEVKMTDGKGRGVFAS